MGVVGTLQYQFRIKYKICLNQAYLWSILCQQSYDYAYESNDRQLKFLEKNIMRNITKCTANIKRR